MKPLKLNVDDLQVESFAAKDSADGIRGTVDGYGKATQETCGCTDGWDTCDTLNTCEHTCLGLTMCGYESQCVGWCDSEYEGCSLNGSCQTF